MDTENRLTVHLPHGKQGTFTIAGPGWIARNVYFDNTGDISIGSGVSISQEAAIYTHEHHHLRDMGIGDAVEKLGVKVSPLVIEDDAYIGTRAIICESCNRIGKHAVIGAGSVVTKDVPPYEIWGGVPARKIKDVE